MAPVAEQDPDRIDWWHQIELPDGYVTPGPDRSADKLSALRLPDLRGKTVLDVGAFDGYFSFAAERMGAARVMALDTYMWRGRPGGKDGFEYARRALGSSVEDVEVEVLDISRETVGEFDIVLFLGVLYHMRHPLLSLERVASVTKGLLVVETLTDMTFLRRPAAAFYPGALLSDETNWWGPNTPAVVGMLRAAGFARVDAFPSRRVRRLRRSAKSSGAAIVGTAGGGSGSRLRLAREMLGHVVSRNRLVAHAWKQA